jgi:hypothetical protein
VSFWTVEAIAARFCSSFCCWRSELGAVLAHLAHYKLVIELGLLRAGALGLEELGGRVGRR